MNGARRRRGVGCLGFLLVYGLCVALMVVLTVGKVETSPLSERSLGMFRVALVESGADGAAPRVVGLPLQYLPDPGEDGRERSFLLPESRVRIEQGDVQTAEVLEEHGDWQLVAYHYANTVSTVSIYRARRDTVEPVSFQLVSHIGQGFYAMFLLVPAYLLTLLLTLLWRRRQRDRPEASS